MLGKEAYLSMVSLLDKEGNCIGQMISHHLPLKKEILERYAKKTFNTVHPCILERKRIERDACVELFGQLEKNKLYSKNDIPWLFDSYRLECDYLKVE